MDQRNSTPKAEYLTFINISNLVKICADFEKDILMTEAMVTQTEKFKDSTTGGNIFQPSHTY